MSRPLVISDCDEVLLHMVTAYKDWLSEDHAIDFALDGTPFAEAMTRRGGGAPITEADMHAYLDLFFENEMHRQVPIEGAVEAIAQLQREAEVIILTNIADRFSQFRARQLRQFGIDVPVYTNQGPKGPAVARLVAERAPTRAVFIDDIAHHHASVQKEAPEVFRLHFCGEPVVSAFIPCAEAQGHANARIDNWAEALPWLLNTLHGTRP